MTQILELFGASTKSDANWDAMVRDHHVVEASRADAMHFHSYSFLETDGRYDLRLERRLSTDAEGVAACLGLNAEPEIGLGEIVAQLERKISTATLLRIGGGGSAAGM